MKVRDLHQYDGYDSAMFTNSHKRYEKYSIGDFTYGLPEIFDFSNYDDIATKPTKLSIGKFCSIANVKIVLGSEHRTDWVSTYPFNALSKRFRHIKGHPSTKGDIEIGNDVWIATNVTILSGVKIGDGAVIGANSLVVSDIPPYSIATGNPAKVLKKRFDDSVISQLEEIKWWNLPLGIIENHVELLQSANIEGFISEIKKAINEKMDR